MILCSGESSHVLAHSDSFVGLIAAGPGEAHWTKVSASLGQVHALTFSAALFLTRLLNSNTLLRMPQGQRPCLMQIYSTITLQMLSEWMKEWMKQPQRAAELVYLESWILCILFSAFSPLLLVAMVHTHTWSCTEYTLSASSQHLKNGFAFTWCFL